MAIQDSSETMLDIMRTIVNEQYAREEVRNVIGQARSAAVKKIMELMMVLKPDSAGLHDSTAGEGVEQRRDKLAATLLYFFLERHPELFLEPLSDMSDSDLDTLAYRIVARTGG